MPQNAKTIPTDRNGHPRVSITASKRLQMAEISELKHTDLATGLVTLEGKNSIIMCISRHYTGNHTRVSEKSYKLL